MVLILSSAVIVSLATTYPTIPRVFGPGSFIPIGYLNEDFNALASGLNSGLYKINVNELYINNSLFTDSNRNMTLGNMTITGNLSVQGNFNVTGNTSATFNTLAVITLNSLTAIVSPILAVSTLNASTISTNTLSVPLISVTTINASNASIGNANITMTAGSINGSSIGNVSRNSSIFNQTSSRFNQVVNGSFAAGTNFQGIATTHLSKSSLTSSTTITMSIGIGDYNLVNPYWLEITALGYTSGVMVYDKEMFWGLRNDPTAGGNITLTGNKQISVTGSVTLNVAYLAGNNTWDTGLLITATFTGTPAYKVLDVIVRTDTPIKNWQEYGNDISNFTNF